MVFGVDINDLCVNNLTESENFCGSSDSSVSDLSDVDETVNAGDDLCKCTEGHHGNDGYGSNVIDGVLVSEELPRIGVFSLVAEGDSVLLTVEVLNEYFESIADGNNVLGRRNAEPRKFSGVNHTVNAAEVNECAVGSNALNLTGVVLAYFDVSPEVFEKSFSFFSCDYADRTDCALSVFLDFNDFEFLLGAYDALKIAVLGNVGLGSGDEDLLRKSNCDNAALNCFGDLAFENFFVFFSSNDLVPVVVCVNFLLGKSSDTVEVAYADCNCFYFVTDLERSSSLA